MSYDTLGAIKVLQDGLKPDRSHTFIQADALLRHSFPVAQLAGCLMVLDCIQLIFELAWTLLSQRKYEEAAEAFIRMTEMNSWSHATYYFIAAGCHISLKNYDRAQKLLDGIPDLLDKKKIGGKDLPTEVFIKKKREWLKLPLPTTYSAGFSCTLHLVQFYQDKQTRRTGSEKDYARCIRISPAEGMCWILHNRFSILSLLRSRPNPFGI